MIFSRLKIYPLVIETDSMEKNNLIKVCWQDDIFSLGKMGGGESSKIMQKN